MFFYKIFVFKNFFSKLFCTIWVIDSGLNCTIGNSSEKKYPLLSSNIYPIENDNLIENSKEKKMKLQNQNFFNLKELKEEYSSSIFPFDEFLLYKISKCRNDNHVIFDTDEIKELLFFGIPSIEPNNNMYKSIFLSLITGEYYKIISDFLISIRTKLIVITLENIFYKLSIFSNEINMKEKILFYSIMYANNNQKIKEFNNLVYCNDFEAVKIFLNSVINDFSEKLKIQNLSETKLVKEFNSNKNEQTSENKIYEKIESFAYNIYKNHLELLENFDELLFDKTTCKTKQIHFDDLDEIFSLLLTKIPKENDKLNFWKTIDKIFFAIDFLHNGFFNFFLEKVCLHVCSKNETVVEFISNNLEGIVEKIIISFEEIQLFDIFFLYEFKNLLSLNNFLQTPVLFLDFIILLNLPEIKLNNFFLQDFDFYKFIGPKTINFFLSFFEKLSKNVSIIRIGTIIKISCVEKNNIKNGYTFTETILHFFLRFVLRESYLFFCNSEDFNQEIEKMYFNIYTLLEIKSTFYSISSVPFFKNEHDSACVINTKIIENFINNVDFIENKSFYIENNHDTLYFNSMKLNHELDKILLSGKANNLFIETDWHINAILNGNFHHIILYNSNYNDLIFEDYNFELGNLLNIYYCNISIITTSILVLNIYDFFYITRRYRSVMKKCLIELSRTSFTGLNLNINLFNIPNNIHKIHLSYSKINNKNRDIELINFSTNYFNQNNQYNFFYCQFTAEAKFFSAIKELKFENCIFEKWLKISSVYTLENLQIIRCIGNIVFKQIYFSVNEAHSEKIITYISKKECIVKNYILVSSFYINFDVKYIEFFNNDIQSDILIKFSQINISNCTGNFHLYLDLDMNYGKLGRFELRKDSKIEIIYSEILKIFKFENLIFYKTRNSILNLDPRYTIEFKNCIKKIDDDSRTTII